MTRRHTHTVLRAATVALWAAAAAAVAAAVWLPVEPFDAPPPPAAVATRPTSAPAVTFDDVLDVNLRRPLVDPPTTAPASAVALAIPVARLAGIVDEPGHSFAVFVTPTGATEVRTVGQRTGAAEVVAITPAAVTVRVAGALTTLRLPVR